MTKPRETICEDCGKPFSPGSVSSDSPACEECLIARLEKFPILPPRLRSASPSPVSQDTMDWAAHQIEASGLDGPLAKNPDVSLKTLRQLLDESRPAASPSPPPASQAEHAAPVGWMAHCVTTGGRAYFHSEGLAEEYGNRIYGRHGYRIVPLHEASPSPPERRGGAQDARETALEIIRMANFVYDNHDGDDAAWLAMEQSYLALIVDALAAAPSPETETGGARFDAAEPAKTYARTLKAPIVVKADGLAAGKAVVVARTVAEAETTIDMLFGGALGKAGERVIVAPAPVSADALREALEELELLREAITDDSLSRDSLKWLAGRRPAPVTPEVIEWTAKMAKKVSASDAISAASGRGEK